MGWQVSTSLHTAHAIDALEMGLWHRDRHGRLSGMLLWTVKGSLTRFPGRSVATGR